MNITELLKNKDILISLFLSIIAFCYQYFIKFILLYLEDSYLYLFINNIILYIPESVSDSESDSSSDLESELECKENENLEYIKILNLFNINSNYNKNNQKINIQTKIIIVNCFLFNYNQELEIINLTDIFYFTRKLVILYNIANKLNTHVIKELCLNYKYMYILYSTNSNEYKYLIIDLDNNLDIYKNKKILFNTIKL